MERGEKPSEGLHPIEAFDLKRNHGHERLVRRSVSRKHQVQAFSVSQIMEDVKVAFGAADFRPFGWERTPASSNGRRRRRQYDRSGVFLRKPEDLRLGGFQRWCDREIAGPIVYSPVPPLTALLQSKRC
jgi:hypothetical protein